MEKKFQGKNHFSVLINLLRDRQTFLEEIRQGVRLQSKIIALLVCSSLFFAIYGAIIGLYHSVPQSLSAAVKLPCLYLLTLLICLPTLYIFNIFFGSRRSLTQHFIIVLTAASVISALLLGFAPVTLFFLITTDNYQFFKLLNVAIFILTGVIGVNFLYKGMQLISEEDTEGQGTRTKILQFWLVLYGFVGSQLGWVIRPIFGNPQQQFVLFREMQGNIYLDITKAISEVLGFR
ncbi:actin-binding WH2 domain-containing protein [Argonema antarcticum]|uniref:actin-binding WH2 domain-containing protein n=1 Tax=Argonema antarcticum TaxID=2942763 RepID=UPI002012A727|nr:actin-binding WH2 domain-containing protein [Argonema antarcticum]MCL1470885.1 actin-binding WH2 domain-containing protein [Argonema antarcticum A004/B2]